jgi:tRNA (mo5U34)-methyltransferase
MSFIQVATDEGSEHARQSGWNGDDPLSEQIRSIAWYHTIELPGGVVTPGQFDHRALLPRYGLPASLAGKTALDVATFDGYWAFEMERRGAAVTAIDLDTASKLDFPSQARPLVDAVGELPTIGTGFAIASRALGSSVDRVVSSVYDLDPVTHGTFDFVHCGDLLLHLRDPLTALERIRSVTTGTFLLCDVVDPGAPGGPLGPTVHYRGGWTDVTWWVPSLDALAQMLIDVGFKDVRVNCLYQLTKTYETHGYWRASLTATV